MQAKDLWGLDDGQSIDGRHVSAVLSSLGNAVVHAPSHVKVEGLEGIKEEVAHVLIEVGGEDPPVERVAHSASVHGLPDKVPQRAPRNAVAIAAAVLAGLGQVGRDQRQRDSEIGLVEVVRHVPSEFSVLSPLLHHCVEECQGVDQGPEGLVRALLESFLGNLRVIGAHVELESVGGLRNDLEGSLEDAQGKLVRGLGRQPQSEVLVRLVDLLQDFLQGLEPAGEEVAVLEHDPQAPRATRLDKLLGLGTHALPQRHVLELGTGLESHLLTQFEDIEGRVRARTEDEDHWGHGSGLVVYSRVIQNRWENVLLAHLLDHVLRDPHGDPVDPEAPQQEELLKDVEPVGQVLRKLLVFGRLVIVVLLPGFLVPLDAFQDGAEGVDLVHILCLHISRGGHVLVLIRQLNEVFPALVRDPVKGLLPISLLKAEVTLEEEVKLLSIKLSVRFQELDGHLEGEHELVLLKEAKTRVVVHVEGQSLNDVPQSDVQVRILLGLGKRSIKDGEEGGQRVLVHVENGRERVHDEEEDRASLGGRSVPRPHHVNLLSRFLGLLKLLGNLHGLKLGLLQGVDELLIVQDVAGSIAEFVQKSVLELLQQGLVLGHVLDKLLPSLLQVKALVPDSHVQELRLETLLGHTVVDDGGLASDLRTVLWIRELRGQVEPEAVVPLDSHSRPG